MRKLAVFGASGSTGLCVVNAALNKGLQVRALLRDPSQFPEELRGRVEVVKGDVLNIVDVKNTLEEQEAVVVVLGTRHDAGSTAMMSEGLKNIIAAMEALNINVVSVCLSLYLFQDPEKIPDKLRETTADQQRMFKALDSSDLHWVAVTPSTIVDQPATGYVIQRGVLARHNNKTSAISRHDLAQFLVDSLTMPEHFQKAVGVISKGRR